MKNYRKIIAVLLIGVLVTPFLLYPQKVEARGFFRDLFRVVGRTTKFIVTTPGKIANTLTRPLGPFLGPIAADVLLANAPNRILRVIDKASKIQAGVETFEAQQAKLDNARKILRDRAQEVLADLDYLRQTKTQLGQELLSGNINYDEYRDKFISLDQVMSAYEETANRLNRAADNMRAENLLRQIAGDAIRQTVRNLGQVINRRINDEIANLIDPTLIKKFIGDQGLNASNVIDLILTGDLTRLLQQRGYQTSDPDFKNLLEQLKKDIKDELKRNKNYLRENWRDVLDKKIKEILDKNKVANQNLNQNTNEAGDVSGDLVEDVSSIPKDENGCPPGYTWTPQAGINCSQTNCYPDQIPNAHYSYEGYCVCGSSGSIAENAADPNKECAYPPNYAKCPGCIYECVKLDEDCPLEGIGL